MSRPPEIPPAEDEGAFPHTIGRRAARRALWLAHGERPIARNLAMIGALGWLVVAPTVGGVFLGRWLDRRFHTGIFWTGALICVGLALGCAVAWRRIQEIQREDDR